MKVIKLLRRLLDCGEGKFEGSKIHRMRRKFMLTFIAMKYSKYHTYYNPLSRFQLFSSIPFLSFYLEGCEFA